MKNIPIYILFLVITSLVDAQNTNFRFRHLTYSEGLSNSNVYSFTQDEQGFIWMGTEGGLFRYDGFRSKLYKSHISEKNSLNSNFVFSLLCDSHNNLWVGTYKGLMLYDRRYDQFIDYHLSSKFLPNDAAAVQMIYEVDGKGIFIASNAGGIVVNPASRKIDSVQTAKLRKAVGDQVFMTYFKDSKGNLWIGTLSGLYKWNFNDPHAAHIDLSQYSGKTESNYIIDIHEDRNGTLWVSTRGGGLLKQQADTDEFTAYLHESENPNSIGSNECYYFWENQDGQLWITTNGSGINFYNREKDNFSQLTTSQRNHYDLLNNNTRAIFEDKQGNLWISSFQAGVNILTNSPYDFNHQSFEIGTKKGFQSTSVISFYLENDDILWVGTDGGGLKRMNRSTNQSTTFQPLNEGKYHFPDKVVMNITRDYRGKLWMGTYLEGLIEFDPKTFQIKQYKNNPDDPYSLSSNFVCDIYEDTKGNLWIATNGGGLNLYDDQTGKFYNFKSNHDQHSNSIVNDYVNVIEEDKKGNLWIGTYWGLSKFSIRDFTFENYLSGHDSVNGLGSNVIYSLLLDKMNRLWIGTRMGLERYDFENDRFINYPGIDGISNNQINGILEGDDGHLWISTDDGLFRFHPDTKTAHHFSIEDGLQGNEFYHNACHKGFNGELFFGGYKGYNSFFPDSVKRRYYEPNVILTNLNILDTEIPIGKMKNGRVILDKNITQTEKINLKYSDKSISLGFSAIDFIEGAKNIYAYKLENFDDEWNYTSQKYPFATYTNLSPGEYTFRIKAGKPEFIDQIDQEKTLDIFVKPPIWGTWWAYLVYSVLTILVIVYFWRLSLQRLKERNEIKLEKLKREQTEEISQARMRFFMNISHEIRTPLTLIIGPLEQLLKNKNENHQNRHKFDLMLKNARRLLRLINQLLDLRKIELNKMKVNAEYADVSRFIKDIVLSFEDYAYDQKIDLTFNSAPQSIKIWFDPDKLDKIVFNLLSNAFKYTKERGKIAITLKNNVMLADSPYEYVELIVSDTGKGIKQSNLKNIFDRFYQGDNENDKNQQGWGLGLALTHSFIQMHQGKILVDSVENVGTNFKVYLPNSDQHLTDEEKIHDVNEPGINKYIHISSEPYIEKFPVNGTRNNISREKQYQLLIVEDNKDLRDYLLTELDYHYNCFEAPDGNSGLEMAIDIMPDIIICDIMMPGMNGIELCKSLKNNLITSHIPVVLLTAKSNVDDHISGFESGADAYIPKPFNIDKLVANLNSILENRNKQREKLRGFLGSDSREKPDTKDNKFIRMVEKIIMDHLADTQFGVEELAQEIGMSRAHLHRKMKAIANIGPIDYIKKTKMQKAAELLMHDDMSIGDVSLQVGFNSTSYFSSTFKSYYHMSPKTFVQKSKTT